MAGPALAARPDQYTLTPIMQRQVSRKKPQVPSPLRPDASGPNPPDQPSITPMKTSTVAAPVPAVPLSRGPKPAGTAPKLMPLGLPGEGTQAGDPGSDATPIPSLAPMAPNRPQPGDVVETAQPVGDPAMSLAANGRLGQVTSVPATISGQSQFVKPQASDLQAAGRLMDDTARKLSLEFLWPADRRSHSRIYSRLTGCPVLRQGSSAGTESCILARAAAGSSTPPFNPPSCVLSTSPSIRANAGTSNESGPRGRSPPMTARLFGFSGGRRTSGFSRH